MLSVYLTILGAVIFLFMSAFFSASETALFSIPRERISFFKQSSKKSHQWIFALLHDGQRTLLLILLGNLIVNVTVVGFIYKLMHFFIARNITLITLFVATGIILLFGEIMPKNIAIRNSETIACLIAPVLYHIKITVHPLLLLLQKINIFFLTGFSRHLRKPSPYITLDEFKSSIAESTHDGVVSESEWRILQSVLEAADMPVSKIMTHRSQLPYVSIDNTVYDAVSQMREKEQTMCCVRSKGTTEEITGLVYLLDALKSDESMKIENIMVPVIWIPDSSEIADLIGFMFREKHTHVCVHDEFGAFTGIFSLNTGLNNILKVTSSDSISDTHGIVSQEFDGLTELETMKDWIPPSLVERAKSVRTLNGLISLYLGRIPKTGERFAIDGWNFYIIRSKLNSIKSVLIKKKG